MPKDSSRPSFPATSSDFALPSSIASTSSLTIEETNFVLQRFRRPSMLAPKAVLHSPLQASFTIHSSSPKRKIFSENDCIDDSEVYRDRVLSDSSPSGSSENPTPPLAPNNSEEDLGNKSSRPKPVSTPPRKFSVDGEPHVRHPKRRLSFPLKQPRIFDIVTSESRPGDDEVKSEAAFQRLLASGTELPLQPRTPRAPSDRGRYPEEAGNESQREDTPSEDEEGDSYFLSYPSSVSEPIPISKRHTPASSVNGDDMTNMSISESPSCGSTPMDIDIPSGSPSVSSTPLNQWRYTPPPTSSSMRPNKRKCEFIRIIAQVRCMTSVAVEDRFDPYPASKRRAVSPSVSYLRDPHPIISSPINRSTPRLPISIPVAIPAASAATSATSSPTVGSSYTSFPRTVPMTSSPTLRASMGLASPILRPLGRHRWEDEREVEGAGEAVGGLNLGS
ncbi:hypothetical protein WG66_015092 [Moniliophthora roreri]|nr:hypothetical protein WG66_015092 [Moniliophthora roreri]